MNQQEHNNKRKKNDAQQRALVDALAGVIGSVISLWTFYPIEVWKTNAQAGLLRSSSSSSLSKSSSSSSSLSLSLVLKQFQRLFKGCGIKTLHTTSSSFCYFFVSSIIFSTWTTSSTITNSNSKQLQSQYSQESQPKLSTLTRLFLSAIAAMINTIITLPLDVMSAKLVTESSSSETNKTTPYEDHRTTTTTTTTTNMDTVWDELVEGESFYPASEQEEEEHDHKELFSNHDELFLQNLEHDAENDEEEEEKKDDALLTVTTTTSISTVPLQYYTPPSSKLSIIMSSPPRVSINNKDDEHDAHEDEGDDGKQCQTTNFFDLWKGLIPSLLLCTNPSINYTVFDMMKNSILTQRRRQKRQSQHNHNHNNLTMIDSFIIGLISKSIATITTYPLIRAKVMLMVTSETSMISILCKSYKEHGITKGLYKGCNWQLVHTILKSALMMMIRETITIQTQQLILGNER